MFGRRVALALRFPVHPRLLQTTPFPGQHELASRVLLYQSRRGYATPGRPRNVVGEPSKPVKRSAKRSATKATTPKSPAKQKNQEPKKTAAKKPAAKKPAPKPKKELTEEQKAVKAAKLEKVKLADLKKAALSPPTVGKANAYTIFVTERSKAAAELKQKGGSQGAVQQRVAEFSKATAAAWKECSAADVEHYNHLAHTAKENQQAEYKRWVESHTPEAIQIANRARNRLRLKLKDQKLKWPLIHDERATKRPVTAYLQFNLNRQKSGDFQNIKMTERAKLIGQEWKALSEEEKNKYKALSAEDTKRYTDEYSSTYGHPPPGFNDGHQQAAAAAA